MIPKEPKGVEKEGKVFFPFSSPLLSNRSNETGGGQ